MTISAISRKWGQCKVDKCSSHKPDIKCEFWADPKDRHVILSCDDIMSKRKTGGKSSDFLIFVEKSKVWVAVVELKSTRYKKNEIVSQLGAGCNLAISILRKAKSNKDYEISPVLVAKRHPHSEYLLVKQAVLKVRGRRYHVSFAKCGDVFLCKTP